MNGISRRAGPFVVASCLCFMGCAESRSAQEAPADPVFEPRVVDVGSVLVGESKRFQSRFVNYGNEAIEVGSLEISCGCMDVEVDTKLCEPRDAIVLSGALRPQYSPGDFRHRIILHPKEDHAGPFALELIGKAVSNFAVTPASVELTPDLLAGSAGEAFVRVQNLSGKNVNLQNPVGLPTEVGVGIEKQGLGIEQETKVRITAKAISVAPVILQFQLPTSLPTEPFLTIKALIRPRNSVSISPQAIRLGVVRKAELLNRGEFKFHLAGSLLPRLRIKDVKTPDFVRLASNTTPLSETGDLVFNFTDSFSGLRLAGNIIIEFELKEAHEGMLTPFQIRIPVSGILNDD